MLDFVWLIAPLIAVLAALWRFDLKPGSGGNGCFLVAALILSPVIGFSAQLAVGAWKNVNLEREFARLCEMRRPPDIENLPEIRSFEWRRASGRWDGVQPRNVLEFIRTYEVDFVEVTPDQLSQNAFDPAKVARFTLMAVDDPRAEEVCNAFDAQFPHDAASMFFSREAISHAAGQESCIGFELGGAYQSSYILDWSTEFEEVHLYGGVYARVATYEVIERETGITMVEHHFVTYSQSDRFMELAYWPIARNPNCGEYRYYEPGRYLYIRDASITPSYYSGRRR